MRAISEKQQQILDCIAKCIDEHGYPPSVREICCAVHLKSPSTVQRHLNILEEKGYIRRESGSSRSVTLTRQASPKGIPLLGHVAAGHPILAVEDAQGYIDFDPGESGDFFALGIKGDSMVGAGILDGDTVVVKRQRSAASGDIVIALLGDEATCKRLRIEGQKVLLMPENDKYQPIDGREAAILGRVTALIRNY